MKKRLLLSLSGSAGVLLIAVSVIVVITQRNVKIHPENPNVMTFFESLVPPDEIRYKQKEKKADVSILSPAAGIYQAGAQNSRIIAVDPLIWILDSNLLPLKNFDFRLQDFSNVILPLWEGDGYPILIPGDVPELILPILIKLQEDITAQPPHEVLENYDKYLLTTRELRALSFFDEAFSLLDYWVSIGALSPQWEDFDEVYFQKAVNDRDSAVFLQNLSWKRMQPKDTSFFWTVLPVIPGEGRNSFAVTGRALELTISPRKAVDKELQIIRERMKSPEVPASLIENTGYVPTTGAGPFINKEDRDSRSALRRAAEWIIYP